jgi:hypothetical protein
VTTSRPSLGISPPLWLKESDAPQHVRIISKATGELLRELTLDPNRDYQPTGRPPDPKNEHPDPT